MSDSEGFENLASVDEIPEEGTLAVRRSDGLPVCLIKWQGQITAIADNCTHQDFEMALGDVLPDGTIQCAGHGARFDCMSGAVLQGPATDPIQTFPVRIDGRRVLVGK
jgi:3-phenylpropionate/trans-cinnamate dioxygenase ferredoxin subunit